MLQAETPLSFAHLGALEVGPPALIDMLASAGFNSTGIRMRQAAPGTPQYTLSDPAARRETRARIAETGVSVLYIELVALSRDLDVDELKPMLDAGAEIGARRIVAAGGDEDMGVVAARLAALCSLARDYGMAVDVEFMPFRPVRSLEEAVSLLAMVGQENAHILLDALHFFRSRSSFETLRRLDPRMIGSIQLCDAPVLPPADLVYEARNARLLPGECGLSLDTLLDLLPADLPLGVEVPLAVARPDLDALGRARLSAVATREFLARRAGRTKSAI